MQFSPRKAGFYNLLSFEKDSTIPFERIYKTKYPPNYKPVMVWDGDCNFCAYWIERWKIMTRDEVDYRPYTEALHDFPDIEAHAFRQAVRLIEPNGSVYSGAEAAFRSFQYGKSWGWLWPLYVEVKWFRFGCNTVYDWIAKHRQFMYQITTVMLGSTPQRTRPYWLIYLSAVVLFILWWVLW